MRGKAPECIRTDKQMFSSTDKMTHSYPAVQGGKIEGLIISAVEK